MAKVERLEKSRVKLTIEVPAEQFDEALVKAYKQDVKHFAIPGFRKGKAPRHLIEQKYGESVFYETAFDIVYPSAYESAVTENGLAPINRPDVEIVEVGKGKNLVFEAIFDVMPEVVLGEYKGIEVPVEEYTVTDEMVDAELERERERLIRFVEVDRPAEFGDRVILDYSGSVDGVKFAGGTAEDQTLELGSNTFIPGFEEQLVGMKAGEQKDINVTFPADYHAEDLKGKDAVFAITLKAVQAKELPELNDDFAKDTSEFDTLEELKADKRKKLEESAQRSNKNHKMNEAAKVAADNATIDVPDSLVERETNYILQDISMRLQSQGISFEDYLRFTGQTVAQVKEQYKDDALTRIRIQLTIAEIAKKEGITASEDEIKEQLAEYAKQMNKTVDELFESLSENDRSYFEDQIVADKTMELLIAEAKFVPRKKEEEEKPAKKTRAKSSKKAKEAESTEE